MRSLSVAAQGSAQAVRLPIIGMGGIVTAEDAVEFLLAGATAVAIGTANFVDPVSAVKVIEGLEAYCIANGVPDVRQLVGGVQVGPRKDECLGSKP